MKGKGKGQDPTRTWHGTPQTHTRARARARRASGREERELGKGKGAYSVEDDWSSGYSGYSFDTPLFSSSLAQEASDEWKKSSQRGPTNQPAPQEKGPPARVTSPKEGITSSRTPTTILP